MFSVEIMKNGEWGIITYDEEAKAAGVDFPDENVIANVEEYLYTKKEFNIPESDRLDDYRVDKARPVDELTFFELALCTLYVETGVWVDWSTEKS